MSSLMSDEARRSITRTRIGDIRCNHCGHAGPSKLQGNNGGGYGMPIVLLLIGLVIFWPLAVVAIVWMCIKANQKPRHVCMQCNSNDFETIRAPGDSGLDIAFFVRAAIVIAMLAAVGAGYFAQ